MTGVVPPGGPAQPPPSGATAATVPVEADVQGLPPRLTDLPRAVSLPGTVVATGPGPEGGAVSRIRTAAGEVVLRTAAPLPPGPVTVQIPAGRPPAQAIVQVPTSVATGPPPASVAPSTAGLPPAAVLPPATTVALATAGTGLPTAPTATAGPLAPAPPLAILLPGMSVRAQVLQALPGAAAGAPSPPGATPATPGSPTAGQSPLGPTGATAAPAGATVAGSAPSFPPAVAAQGPVGPAAGGAWPTTGGVGPVAAGPILAGPALASQATSPGIRPTVVPGTPGPPSGPGALAGVPGAGAGPVGAAGFGSPTEGALVGPVGIGTVRVLGVGDGPMRPPLGTGPVAVATVTGTLVGGQPVVSTDRGLLVLQAHPGLPAGTRLTLEAVPAPTPSPLPPLGPIDPFGARDWPALQHALDALSQTDPQAARAIATAIVPQLNARLATNMALFMGVVRAGLDPRAWLGDRGANALEAAGRGELIERLAEDVGMLRRQAESGGAEWRTYPLPLLLDGAMDRVVVRVRRREDDGEGVAEGAGRRGGAGTRFLVDVNLSRLGPLQLDGLVRPKRLDLIVRSREALPDGLRTELRQIFAGALADLRLAGDLGFQAGRGVPWVPLPPPAAGRGVVA